jgi:hypothetical protein
VLMTRGCGCAGSLRALREQAFGRRGIAQRREQEVDCGTGGVDGPVELTPTALHSDIRLVNRRARAQFAHFTRECLKSETGWRRIQSDANCSLAFSLTNREITGNSAIFNPINVRPVAKTPHTYRGFLENSLKIRNREF